MPQKTLSQPKLVSIGIQCNRYLDQTTPLPESDESKEVLSDFGNTTFESEADIHTAMELDSDFIPESEEDQDSDESASEEWYAF